MRRSPELIKSLPLDGALATGDAAFTTSDIAQAIRDRGGHYFLFVKDNQPELRSELQSKRTSLPTLTVAQAGFAA